MEHQNYLPVNRALWDERTAHHARSGFYKMEEFLAGATSLNDIELELLGDVKGKTILHLQCHFGQDTLSLARMGAKVTGVDLSGEAIKKARELNDMLGLDAQFICTDLYSLPDVLQRQFDIVFTSYGTIVWLPDLEKWAGVIAHFLAPGGRFVMADFHPLVLMFDDGLSAITYSYFNTGMIEETEAGTYADPNANINLRSMTWNHSLSETFRSLLEAGLRLTTFREYDHSPYSAFGNMVEASPGRHMVKDKERMFPLVYALTAQKPA